MRENAILKRLGGAAYPEESPQPLLTGKSRDIAGSAHAMSSALKERRAVDGRREAMRKLLHGEEQMIVGKQTIRLPFEAGAV